jgi:hypothetical protein
MTPVDGHARDEYLRDLREEYRLAAKKEKMRLLDEAVSARGWRERLSCENWASPPS